MTPQTALRASTSPIPFAGYTYYLHVDENRISGHTDGLGAVVQSAYKRLHTERFAHPIYSEQYGIELESLFGQTMDYAKAVLPSRILDALMGDDRILGCRDFVFDVDADALHVSFTMQTTEGDTPMALEVAT